MDELTTAPESTTAPDARSGRDAANWAERVTSLAVDPLLPPEAINLNVEGRQLAGPIQGFGQMWRKHHRIRLVGAGVKPAVVIRVWKEHFGEFWPSGNRFYGPLTGLNPGEVAVLNLGMPGGTMLSTGVMVLYADDESFCLMTPQGHVFSGWITFSAYEEAESTVAQVEILMRASDPLFEIGMQLMGHRRENRFWEQTLVALASRFSVQNEAETHVECIDRKMQWMYVTNIWHNSAIRTGIYMGTVPVQRAVSRLRQRGEVR
jgi:hypothetical protein